jgi:hypothetical protein
LYTGAFATPICRVSSPFLRHRTRRPGAQSHVCMPSVFLYLVLREMPVTAPFLTRPQLLTCVSSRVFSH